jgi:hypothetical protein
MINWITSKYESRAMNIVMSPFKFLAAWGLLIGLVVMSAVAFAVIVPVTMVSTAFMITPLMA